MEISKNNKQEIAMENNTIKAISTHAIHLSSDQRSGSENSNIKYKL